MTTHIPTAYNIVCTPIARGLPPGNTGGGTRTHTPLRETDFESVASANSATPA